MKNPYLPPRIKRAKEYIRIAQTDFGVLSQEQLNWKPNAKSWSIAQCLDHLITSNSLYYPQLDLVASGQKQKSFWEKIGFLARFFGNTLVGEIGPVPNKPMNSPEVFRPSQSEIAGDIVERFVKASEFLLQKIEATKQVDHRAVIVTSPAAKFICYSLENACIILTNHLERHVRQAENVRSHEDFPDSQGN